MNIAYEFSKVKESFVKVKKDMYSLADKINENYDEFMKKHEGISREVVALSNMIRDHTESLKKKEREEGISHKEIEQLKSEIRELKEHVNGSLKGNYDLRELVDKVRSNEKDVKALKSQLHSSELEIYLLKERMLEKNIELKQMKEISSHMLKIIEDLSSLEIELINKGRVK
jgi:peptidoglycan hydrolase CwlO-like protein